MTRTEKIILTGIFLIGIIGLALNFAPSEISLESGIEGKGSILSDNEFSDVFFIDINKAEQKDLESLKGIGSAKAKSIIEYREKNGPFFSVEDIKNVSGIGDVIFENNIERLIISEIPERKNSFPTQSGADVVAEYYSSNLININTAGEKDLEGLPGIGVVKARAIVDFRVSNGLFKSKEEIMKVKGIGEKTFESIKDLIYF